MMMASFPKRAKWFAMLAAMFAALTALAYGYYHYQYPYGASHCCDLQLYDRLEEYAAKHDGAYPAGKDSPEASLSLLYKNVDYADANLLRGKTVPESVVQKILDRGELLGPDTCGWHYVEGFHQNDNPHLALFWDKIGLAHNGERLPDGGHIVMFLGGTREYIPEAQWSEFLEKQQKMLAERNGGLELKFDATTRIQGKRMQVQLRVIGKFLYGRVWQEGRFSRGEGVANIDEQPSSGVELHVLTESEVRAAKVVVDELTGHVRFVFKDREVLFDGNDFTFGVATTK